jgi:hypothetical protein
MGARNFARNIGLAIFYWLSRQSQVFFAMPEIPRDQEGQVIFRADVAN